MNLEIISPKEVKEAMKNEYKKLDKLVKYEKHLIRCKTTKNEKKIEEITGMTREDMIEETRNKMDNCWEKILSYEQFLATVAEVKKTKGKNNYAKRKLVK